MYVSRNSACPINCSAINALHYVTTVVILQACTHRLRVLNLITAVLCMHVYMCVCEYVLMYEYIAICVCTCSVGCELSPYKQFFK